MVSSLIKNSLPFVTVPQQNVKIMEMMGRYVRTMDAGLNFRIPFLEQVAYHHSLKEQVLDVDSQTAITLDNVKIKIDGVLYYKIVDPKKASYNISEPVNAISMLAQTSMRGEIGKLKLDRTFAEREHLNLNIRESVNDAAKDWGIQALRYEIKDIQPPPEIKRSMDLEAESERIKRSKITNSEGERQGKINVAQGIKQSAILEGQGKAEQILQEARSIVESLEQIANSLVGADGEEIKDEAMRLRMTEKYLAALHKVYGECQIVMLPEGSQGDNQLSASNLAQAMTLYKKLVGPGGPMVTPA